MGNVKGRAYGKIYEHFYDPAGFVRAFSHWPDHEVYYLQRIMNKPTVPANNHQSAEHPYLFGLSFWLISFILAVGYQWYTGSYVNLFDLFSTSVVIMFGILVVALVTLVYIVLLFIE